MIDCPKCGSQPDVEHLILSTDPPKEVWRYLCRGPVMRPNMNVPYDAHLLTTPFMPSEDEARREWWSVVRNYITQDWRQYE